MRPKLGLDVKRLAQRMKKIGDTTNTVSHSKQEMRKKNMKSAFIIGLLLTSTILQAGDVTIKHAEAAMQAKVSTPHCH